MQDCEIASSAPTPLERLTTIRKGLETLAHDVRAKLWQHHHACTILASPADISKSTTDASGAAASSGPDAIPTSPEMPANEQALVCSMKAEMEEAQKKLDSANAEMAELKDKLVEQQAHNEEQDVMIVLMQRRIRKLESGLKSAMGKLSFAIDQCQIQQDQC